MHLFSGAHHAQHKVVKNVFLCCCLLLLFLVIPRFAHAAPVQLDGELEVKHWDYPNKTTRTKHFLRAANGERYELKFKGQAPQHPTGTKLRVRGDKTGNVITLNAGGTTSTDGAVVTQAIQPNTFGAQNTLVMLVNFQDQPNNKPWTVDQVKNLVFGTVSNFFKENSYQNTWLTGDVVNWSTVPVNSTVCDEVGIANAAKQAATAAGFNLSAYSHYVYIFPFNSACGWAGSATVGGNPSEADINGKLTLDVVGHELGHNLGLSHSRAWSCSDGSIIGTSGSCASVEYGDGVDIMGSAYGGGHFHAYQKELLGWLNYGSMPAITTVQTSGTYTIDPYETTGTNAKALKILKGVDPVSGKNVYYYIEYRQAVGFDSWIATAGSPGGSPMNASNLLNGVIVHMNTEGVYNRNYLLDMTPATYNMYPWDPALVVGQTFTDSAAGLTITTRWVNSTNAAVDVTFTKVASTCTRANPSVLVSSSQATSVAAGTAVTYTVALTNNDSSACAASTFNLQSAVPAGWSGSLGSTAVTVSPGSATSTTLTAVSASTAVAGTYSVGATATNSASSRSASGSASYVIGTSSTTTTTTKGKGRTK